MNQNTLVGKALIKMNKEDAFFVYFTLESHEGLCSFSTMPHEKGQASRFIEMTYSLTLKKQFDHLLDQLKKHLSLEIIEPN